MHFRTGKSRVLSRAYSQSASLASRYVATLARSRTLVGIARAACSALVIACSDVTATQANSQTAAAAMGSRSGPALHMRQRAEVFGAPGDRELDAARNLARGIAKALADSGVRQALKRAMAASAVPEGKLHFASYVSGRGGALARALSAQGGVSPQMLQSYAEALRDLELYMPVDAHREAWRGGDVVVGIALDEDQAPIAFDSHGTPVRLDREFAPTTPVLILAPVETDFSSQTEANLAGRAELACAMADDQTLAAAARLCSRDDTSRQAEGVSRSLSRVPRRSTLTNSNGDSAAIRLTFLRIYEGCGGECWFWGDPEYDIFAIGKAAASDTSGSVIQCSGQNPQHANQPGLRDDAFRFDQNNHFWIGRVALLTADQVDRLRETSDSVFTFELYEDDYERCTIAVNKEYRLSAWDSYLRSVTNGLIGGMLVVTSDTAWGPVRTIAFYGNVTSAFYYMIKHLKNAILGDDDYLGTFVLKSETQWANDFPDNNFVVVKGSEMLARATITGLPDEPPHGALDRIDLSADSLVLPVQHLRDVDAYGFDAYGASVPIGEATWSSSSSATATVDTSGVVTGQAVGDATLTAVYAGKQRSIPVRVRNAGAVASVVISASTFTVEERGVLQLTAVGYDAFGTTVPVTPSQWVSSDTYVATVLSDGRVIGEAPGSATVTVIMDGVSASKTVRVIEEQCVPPPGEKKCD